MQFGQVPVMFVPEAQVNDTRSVTLEPEGGDVITPSLTAATRPGEAPAVTEVKAAPTIMNTWLVVGGLIAALWLFSRKR